jgi:ADP-ribose pyrophosphatase
MERTIAARRAFDGRLLRVDVLEVELDSGKRASREIVRHPGAVVVVAELPDGELLLVRQYRKAVEMDLLEFCAGTLESGEKPELCAMREVREETGHGVRQLMRLGELCLAPGYSEERLHVFHAQLSAEAGDRAPDEDEVVETVLMTKNDFETLLGDGGVVDAKTLAAWQLYKARLARWGTMELKR